MYPRRMLLSSGKHTVKAGLVVSALFWCLTTGAQSNVILKKQVEALSVQSTERSAIALSALWDSLYFGSNKPYMYQYLTEQEWQGYFEKRMERPASDSARIQLAFALSAIYHTQSKFLKSKPLLEWLLTQKNRLSEKKYHLVLIKLEENYRALFLLEKAVDIRKQRVALGLIKNYWALYEECGLYELALQDFGLFEPIPKKGSYDYIKYLSSKANLYLGANKVAEARNIFKEGLDAATLFYQRNKDQKQFPPLGKFHWIGLFELGTAKCFLKERHYNTALNITLNATDRLNGYYKMEGWFIVADIQKALKNASLLKTYIDSLSIYSSNIENNYTYKLHFDQILRDYYHLIGNAEKYNVYALMAAEGELMKSNAALSVYKKEVIKNLSTLEIKERRDELKRSYAIIRYQTLGIVGMVAGLVLLSLFLAFLGNKAKERKKYALIMAYKNAELEAKSEELIRQTEYAQWLLKELHHRVKNNLQVVSSMLNLQYRRTNLPEIASSLQSLQTRIQSIAIMHQHLYQENEGELLDMRAYIENLVNQLKSTYTDLSSNVHITVEVDPCRMSISMAMPLGLIITEIVSNSLKYAFPSKESGNIQIRLLARGEDIQMVVKDDGVGLNQEQYSDDHLGIRLINILAKQIKATVSTVSNAGVQYTLTFKTSSHAHIDR